MSDEFPRITFAAANSNRNIRRMSVNVVPQKNGERTTPHLKKKIHCWLLLSQTSIFIKFWYAYSKNSTRRAFVYDS